jgi:hypothetical protein
MLKTIYVTHEILKWDAYISGSSSNDLDDVMRPYQILAHSESLITKDATAFYLADALGNLKRALNHRLQLIERLYQLKTLKFDGMPKGYLELLEKYGLARPYLIKKLMEIRNDIEHKDKRPPRVDRCRELLDVTWYFLKSTDKLVSSIPLDIELAPYYSHNLAEKYSCAIEVKFPRKDFKVSGWLPIKYINKERSDNSFKIICTTIHDGLYWKGKDETYHKDKTVDDIWIIGKFSVTPNEKKLLLRKMLELN